LTFRAVFDINVWVTGVAGPGTTYPYLPLVPPTGENSSADCMSLAFDGESFQIFISPHIIRNAYRVLVEAGVSQLTAQRFIDEIVEIVHLSGGSVVEPKREAVELKDFEDNLILDLAIQTSAQVIVTRDLEFQRKSGLRGIAIVDPKTFLNLALSSISDNLT
jgi:predicted nucleic acid-binding protein